MKAYRAVPFYDVSIRGGFWQHRQQLNRDVTTPAVMNRFMETGRFAAFRCDWREGMPNRPHIFWDSDIAKWMEGVAYLLESAPAPELEKVVEETIDEIERHQGPDGYVNSYFTSVEPSKRFTNRSWHELYCAGHLIEAAVAWKHATGRDRFLKIMCRYADYIDQVFRVEGSAQFVTPGHEEIELALVKLYHATGEEKYLNLSRFFIDQRGVNDRDYPEDTPECKYRELQSHLPCREQFTAEGHAVRAGYLYSAMADLARECDDAALLDACRKLFDNITLRRMYITGGVGSTHNRETFTIDYDLPNETAYTETCAAISMAYFAQRMLTIDPQSKYADLVERVLYNGFLSGTSLSGDEFFYTNPMEIVVSRRYAHPSSETGDWLPITQRVKVFGCSCCPPNVTRFVASIGDYLYTCDDERIYVHQFMTSDAHIDGAHVAVETDYPVSGTIRIAAEALSGRAVCVRIPSWCRAFTLNVPYTMDRGYAVIACDDARDIVLTLDVAPQLIEANPSVADAALKAAVMRGPIVYCLEGVDNGGALHNLLLDPRTGFEEIPCDFSPLPMLRVNGFARPQLKGEWLYRPAQYTLEEKPLTLIPYYTFANRGESDMKVFIPVKY